MSCFIVHYMVILGLHFFSKMAFISDAFIWIEEYKTFELCFRKGTLFASDIFSLILAQKHFFFIVPT